MTDARERVEVTPELLANLEAKAWAATPGPWEACVGSARRGSWMDLSSGTQGQAPDGESCKCRMVYADGPPVAYALAAEDESFTCGEGATKEMARANARYIGAANPAVLLALVKRIRELEADLAEAYSDERLHHP